MNITSFQELITEAGNMTKKTAIAVVQAQDEHTLEAVVRAKTAGIAEPLLLGDAAKITALLKQFGADPQAYEVIPAEDTPAALKTAVELIHAGRAGAIMKGKLESADYLRAILSKDNNLRGSGTLSVFGIFKPERYHKIVALSDMGMNLAPDLMGKKAILENGVAFLRALGIDRPKVAVLSEAEKVNPKVPASVDAAELKAMNERGEIQNCVVEGPISLDLALSRESAAIKGYDSPVAGDADFLLVPEIVSGNILVKSFLTLAGAEAAGAVLGAKIPVMMFSRSSEASEKFNSVALAALAAR
jgi:phosphate butyryltransferase